MPTSEIPTFGLLEDGGNFPDLTPIPFKIATYDENRVPTISTFRARAVVPMGILIDLAASASEAGKIDGGAIKAFFDAVVIDEDAEAFSDLLRDPHRYVIETALEGLAKHLAEQYGNQDGGDRPTNGSSASAGGPGTTGPTSTAPVVATAFTSEPSP